MQQRSFTYFLIFKVVHLVSEESEILSMRTGLKTLLSGSDLENHLVPLADLFVAYTLNLFFT